MTNVEANGIGGLIVDGRPSEPSTLAQDDEAGARLWALSETLTGWHATP